MILSVLAVIFLLSAATAYFVGSRYTTSDAPKGKLSVFANSYNNNNNNNDDRLGSSVSGSKDNTARYAPCLSIVIPCYNEEERLPIMLDQTIKFCKDTVDECRNLADAEKSRQLGHFGDFEIIVVDDCSKDNTVGVFEKYKKAHPGSKLLIVSVKPNRGKGFAVRSGFLAASGDYVLMADGDGATKINDVCKLLSNIRTTLVSESTCDGSNSTNNNNSNVAAASSSSSCVVRSSGDVKKSERYKHAFIAVGSRAHLEDEAIAQRTIFRTILMKAFHLVVQVTYLCGTRGSVCHIHDTQCGFKLFDRRLCEPIFLNNRLERFAFDVELLICAKRLGLKVVEVPVNWKEIPGSKVNMKAMAQMGLDCLLMCFTYGLGFWGVVRKF